MRRLILVVGGLWSLFVQAWHFFEHGQIQIQYYVGWHLWGGPKPGSILEFLMPRIELHSIYNVAVFVPTLIAVMLYSSRLVRIKSKTADLSE
jgi:hypothetical protein